MSILDLNLQNIPDPEPVEPGQYLLRVISVEEKTSAKGNPMILVMLKVTEHPEAPPIFNYFNLPYEGCNPQFTQISLMQLKQFHQAFDLPLDGPSDTEEWVGREGWAMVGVEIDERYGASNTVKRFLLPK